MLVCVKSFVLLGKREWQMFKFTSINKDLRTSFGGNREQVIISSGKLKEWDPDKDEYFQGIGKIRGLLEWKKKEFELICTRNGLQWFLSSNRGGETFHWPFYGLKHFDPENFSCKT